MNQEQINQVEKLAQAASDMKLMLVIYPGPVLDLVFLVERLRKEVTQVENKNLDLYVEREELRERTERLQAEIERLQAELARYKEVVGATLDDEAGNGDPVNRS